MGAGGYHTGQSAFDREGDSQKLAQSYLRHRLWPAVYAELSREEGTTHSAQSWRNFHAKHRPAVAKAIDAATQRRQQRPEDGPGSPPSPDAPPPPQRSGYGIPARPKQQPTRRPPPDIHDFGPSDGEDETDELQTDDQEVDQLADSHSPAPPPAERPVAAKGKARAAGITEREPSARSGSAHPTRASPAKRRRTEPLFRPESRDQSPAVVPPRRSLPGRVADDSPVVATVRSKNFEVDVKMTDVVVFEAPGGLVVRASPAKAADGLAHVNGQPSSDEEGPETQMMRRALLPRRPSEPARLGDSPNSSDVVRSSVLPRKRAGGRSVAAAASDSDTTTEDDEHFTALREALGHRAVPVQETSPRRLRSHAQTSPTKALSGVEHARDTRTRPTTLSSADLEACFALARWARSHGMLTASAYDAYVACCGDLRVLECLNVPPAQRTESHANLVAQGVWSAHDDAIVLTGSDLQKRAVEKQRGIGSIEWRRHYVERTRHADA